MIEDPYASCFNPTVVFVSSDHHKILSIPLDKEGDTDQNKTNKNSNNYLVSRSWGEDNFVYRAKPKSLTKISDIKSSKSDEESSNSFKYKHVNSPTFTDFRPYDAINNCKSAGIIPYTIHNGELLFLLQRFVNLERKKYNGWNDFGGKRSNIAESTAETAAREFCEETSCLFYLTETSDSSSPNSEENKRLYDLFKDNPSLSYDQETIELLKKTIVESQKYFVDKITEYVSPIYISSKETYISYFVQVKYIPESDIPRAEDIHIPYTLRYMRECRWFTYNELINMKDIEFHKRLQITRIQQRISSYCAKGLFS